MRFPFEGECSPLKAAQYLSELSDKKRRSGSTLPPDVIFYDLVLDAVCRWGLDRGWIKKINCAKVALQAYQNIQKINSLYLTSFTITDHLTVEGIYEVIRLSSQIQRKDEFVPTSIIDALGMLSAVKCISACQKRELIHLTDLGSGEGGVLLAAMATGYGKITGIEKDKYLAEKSRQLLYQAVVKGKFYNVEYSIYQHAFHLEPQKNNIILSREMADTDIVYAYHWSKDFDYVLSTYVNNCNADCLLVVYRNGNGWEMSPNVMKEYSIKHIRPERFI